MSASICWRAGVLSLALCALTVPATARAEVASTRTTYTDTVRVSASKLRSRLAELATSATILSPDQLRASSSRGLQDLLAQVPGAHVLDPSGSGTGGAVEARGFAAQGTTSSMLVLVDGVPLNDPESGRVDWNVLAPSQLERIEVLRGPSSLLYGSTTLAGLVNLVTRGGATPSVWGEASGGDFGRAAASGGASWGSARVSGSLGGMFAHGDGERDNSGTELSSGRASLAAALGRGWALHSQLLGSSNTRRIPGPLPAPDWLDASQRTQSPDDHRDEDALDGSLEISGHLGPAWEVTGTSEGSLRKIDAFETVIPVGGLARTSRMRGTRQELRAHWTPASVHAPSLLLGTEGRAGRLESRYFTPGGSADPPVGAADVARTTGGAYALLHGSLGAGVSASAGARVDWSRSHTDDPTDALPVSANDDQRAVSPTAGLLWARPGVASAWVSYAGAFKSPELEQLYDPRPYDLGFGVLHISNNTLQPQRDDHWDAGARVRAGGVWVEGAVYYARARNELGFDYSTFRISNIARSRHAGVEAQITVPPTNGVSGVLSMAWTRATFEGGDFDGKQINTVPEQSGFARVSFEHRARGTVSLEVSGVARQWIDEANTQRLPDYALVHVSARQPVGPVELFGSVRNLADRHHATVGYVTLDETGQPLALYFPGAGRSFTLGIRMRRDL